MSVVERAYLSRVREFHGECAFRGQADSSWDLHSAATRRLISYFNGDEKVTKTSQYPRTFATYHRTILVEPARLQGLGNDAGQPISDLQLLAKLQQNGAATGLIDFSWDPLVALWFACEADHRDGRVIVLDLGDRRSFRRMPFDEGVNGVEEIFLQSEGEREQFYFEATVQGEGAVRVLRQRGVFVIGRPMVPEGAVRTIEISGSDKEAIREELEAHYDISERTLFADVQGFSAANSVQSPMRQIEDAEFFLLKGIQAARVRNYASAVAHYDKSIELAPEAAESYFLRGNAKAGLCDFARAGRDYDVVVQLRTQQGIGGDGSEGGETEQSLRSAIYYNRGNVRAELEDLEGALADYNEADRTPRQSDQASGQLYCNRGNVNALLLNSDDADHDFQKAIGLGEDYVLFNRGNLLTSMGRFEEALQCYEELIEKGKDQFGLEFNRLAVEGILKRIGGASYEVHLPRRDGAKGWKAIDVTVRGAVGGTYKDFFNFYGSTGNAGNLGGIGIPGGDGYAGKEGFVVILKGEKS